MPKRGNVHYSFHAISSGLRRALVFHYGDSPACSQSAETVFVDALEFVVKCDSADAAGDRPHAGLQFFKAGFVFVMSRHEPLVGQYPE